MKALLLKELKQNLSSPFFFFLASLFLGVSGWLFFQYQVSFQKLPDAVFAQTLLQTLFGNLGFMFMFFTPLLTMKSFAEESAKGTLDFLFSTPLRDWEIIGAKYLSTLALSLILLLSTILFPLILSVSGFSNWGYYFGSVLGMVLLIGCYNALGVFASSLTNNSLISAFLSFSFLLFFLLVAASTQMIKIPLVATFVSYFSPAYHFNSFSMGGAYSYNFIFFLSFTFFFLSLTKAKLQMRLW